jgi:hypothetical protein
MRSEGPVNADQYGAIPAAFFQNPQRRRQEKASQEAGPVPSHWRGQMHERGDPVGLGTGVDDTDDPPR